jgi:hypothetical protein
LANHRLIISRVGAIRICVYLRRYPYIVIGEVPENPKTGSQAVAAIKPSTNQFSLSTL